MWSRPSSPPETARLTLFRINGVQNSKGRLFYLDDAGDVTAWRWRGVISGTEQGTDADNVTSGYGYCTVAIQGHRMYIADGGVARKVFLLTNPGKIVDWGLNAPTLSTPTIASEATGGTGYLLSDRKYAYQYQLIDEETGFMSVLSPVSNVWLTTLPGDNSALTGSIPAIAGLASGSYTVRIFRSPGAIPPSVPAEYRFEKDYEGITNLATTPLAVVLEKLDGDLTSVSVEVYPLVPRGKYVMIDASGDRAILFGDPTAPNVVYWSQDGNYGNWPPVQQTLPIDDDTGDVLRGGYAGLNGRVFVMKLSRGIYELQQSINGAYIPVRLTTAFGCWSHYSIVCRGGTLFWVSLEGAVAFSGQEPVNISDERVSELLWRVVSGFSINNDIALPYATEGRQPGHATIQTLVRDPTTDYIYRLIYDIGLRNWTIYWYADGVVAGGGVPSITWRILGATGEDILTADGAGQCFAMSNFPTRLSAPPDYEDGVTLGASYPFTWEIRTAWLGNGIDNYIPRFFDFLQRFIGGPGDTPVGPVTVSLYINGSDTPVHSTTFTYPNALNWPDRRYGIFRFRCNSLQQPVRMFRFGLSQSGPGGVFIPWAQAKYTSSAPRLKGLAVGG